ncbi:MAG: CoA-binding protein [Thermoplasmata archaeon]
MPNPSDDRLREILTRSRTIAVVGLSDKLDRDSNEIARYLQSSGYRVLPVNPLVPEILGERSYPTVSAIPSSISVDLVDVFRRSDQVEPTMSEAIARRVPTVWMQLGVENAAARAAGEKAGLTVIENLCIMVVHRRLKIPPRPGSV